MDIEIKMHITQKEKYEFYTNTNTRRYILQGWDGWVHMTKTPVGATSACAAVHRFALSW